METADLSILFSTILLVRWLRTTCHKFTISSDELRNILSDEARLSFSTVSHIAHALGMKLIIAEADPPPEEIIYRTIGKEEAQGEILDLLDAEPDLCYDDISDRLRIELEMVVDICIELEDTEASHQG